MSNFDWKFEHEPIDFELGKMKKIVKVIIKENKAFKYITKKEAINNRVVLQ